MQSKKSKHLTLTSSGFTHYLLLVGFIVIFGAIITIGYIHIKDSGSGNSSSSFVTYINSKNLLVEASGKTVATIKHKNGDDTFDVMVNNGRSVLVRDYKQPGFDTEGTFYVISNQGKIIELSSKVAKKLTGDEIVSASNLSQSLLTKRNEYLYIACDNQYPKSAKDATCAIKSLDLKNAQTKTIFTSPINVSGADGSFLSGFTSIGLLGIDDQTIYAYTLPADLDTKHTSTKLINQFNGTVSRTFSTPEVTNNLLLSPNFRYLAYSATEQTSSPANQIRSQVDILHFINLQDGKKTTVNGGVIYDTFELTWSPDSNYLAFIAQTSLRDYSNEYSMDYAIPTSTTASVIKKFKSSRPIIQGWASSKMLTYLSPDYNAIDVATSKAKTNPQPAGYQLVTPYSSNNDRPFSN